MLIDRSLLPGAVGMLNRGALPPMRELSLEDIYRWGRPERGLSDEVNDWRLDNFQIIAERGLPELLEARAKRLPYFYGALFLARSPHGDDPLDHFGLASLRVVTNNGVGFIVNAFLGTTALTNMKYHGIGTGTAAEAQTDAALVTECTTALNPDNVRATGTTVAFAANIYQTVATNNVDAITAVAEHGIFSSATVAAASASNVLWDRSQFAAVNLAIGDGIQTDYRGTFTAGG
jgi:hypothetical protein